VDQAQLRSGSIKVMACLHPTLNAVAAYMPMKDDDLPHNVIWGGSLSALDHNDYPWLLEIYRDGAARVPGNERETQPRALLIAENVLQSLRREERAAGFDRLPGSLTFNRPDERAVLAGSGGARLEALGEH
jgi:hypothetical protein